MRLQYTSARLIFTILIMVTVSGCAIDPMEQLSNDIVSQDKIVRTQAIYDLANLQDPRATEHLLDALEKDDELMDLAGVALVKKGREFETKATSQSNPIVEKIADIMNNPHAGKTRILFRGSSLRDYHGRIARPP